MKLKVTEKGVLIPKELLGNSQEVEIIQQENQIIITTINNNNISIWDLGKNPVDCDINDAAINHDQYIYK
jgi:virulence-associated protein VagC